MLIQDFFQKAFTKTQRYAYRKYIRLNASSLRSCIFGVEVSFRRVRKIAKRDYWLRLVCPSVCPSVCLHGTTRLLRDGFSINLAFEYFSKICRESSSFFKIGQE